MIATKRARVTPGASDSSALGRVLLIGKHSEITDGLTDALADRKDTLDFAAGSADALHRLRSTPYEIVITNPETSIEEDLALLEEIRLVRPGVRAIVLAPTGTPEEIIAALRARVYLCKCAPFDVEEIAGYVARGMSGAGTMMGIEVLSAHRDWISVRIDCNFLTAERLISYLEELQTEMPATPRQELMEAFREVLLSSVEQGAQCHPARILDVAAVRTVRTIVFYLHDPGLALPLDAAQSAFSDESAGQADTPAPNAYQSLIARGVVDELIVSETGHELLLIKHTM